MSRFKFFKYDEKAMELSINIVVMLVVGIVALATLISIVPTPTKEISVFVEKAAIKGGTLQEGSTVLVSAKTAENSFGVTVVVKATDKDGNPVRDANVVLTGLGGAASNTTDINGMSVLTTKDSAPVRLDPNQNEGTMDLKVLADGFYDYEKKGAVMIVKIR